MFFIRKWERILEFVSSGGSASSLSQMRQFRAEAAQNHHWETVRDCDRFEAIQFKDEHLLTHLYFGTPFTSFRERMLIDLGPNVSFPTSYLWRLGGGEPTPPVLDLFTGKVSGSLAHLKPGFLLHILLVIFSSDFYRPLRLASIHTQLYPKQYFNPVSAPLKVHQALKRLRQWSKENRVPLSLKETSGEYSVQSNQTLAIAISHKESLTERNEILLCCLKEKWLRESFSVRDISRFLNISIPTALRLVNWGLGQRMLKQEGNGAFTKYFVESEVLNTSPLKRTG